MYIYNTYTYSTHYAPARPIQKRAAGRPKQDKAGDKKGATDCNLYDIHNDILRTNAPDGAAG